MTNLTNAQLAEWQGLAKKVVGIFEQFEHGEISAELLMELARDNPEATVTLARALLAVSESERSTIKSLQAARAALRGLLAFAPDVDGNYSSSGGSDSMRRWKVETDKARAALGEEAQ